MKENSIDMTNGSILNKLLWFALPVFLSALLQQAYVLVDSLIVSKLLGDLALAAVSNCENVAWLITSFMFGIGMGASVLIAQAYGANDPKWMHKIEGTSYSLCFILSIVLFFASFIITGPILQWMNTPEEVFRSSNLYLSIYIGGAGGVLLYNMGSAILQAVGNSKVPLYFLVVSTLINITCDITSIKVFHMGVEGAAIATVIAEWITGIGLYIYMLKVEGIQKIHWTLTRIDPYALKEILRMGIPGAIESSAVSLANTIVQGFINTFGPLAMAASGAFASIEGFGFLPITAFCQALGTFTGQNVGAHKEDRTKKGCHYGLIMMSISAFAIGMLILVFCTPLMQIFTNNPETIAYGAARANITLWFYPLLGLTHCLAAIFRGAGKPIVPMLAYLGSWGVLRVLILMIVVPRFHEFSILCWVYPLTWTISTAFLSLYYIKGSWFPKEKNESGGLCMEIE